MPQKQNVRTALFCLLSAAVLVGLCSKSSLLYPFNHWEDANAYFTVGKAMMNGLVPYRDAYDHKGPLMFLIQGIGWLFSHDSFHGVFALEVAAVAAFLYYGLQIMRCLVPKASLAWVPVLCTLTLATYCFAHGDSAEEFALPMLAYSLYCAVRHFTAQGDQPAPLPLLQVFASGVLAGCVFWLKFTMCGFYVGWAIVLACDYIRKRWFVPLLKSTLAVALGVLAATAPWVIYFGASGALRDLWQGYLYNNIFVYNRNAGQPLWMILRGAGLSLWAGFFENPLIGVPVLLGLAGTFLYGVRAKRPGLSLCAVVSLLTLTCFVYPSRAFYYYFLIFAVYAPFGLAALQSGLCRICEKFAALRRNESPIKSALLAKTCPLVVLVLSAVLAVLLSPNTYMLGVERDSLPQYQLQKLIDSENPTLLNYSSHDVGLGTVLSYMPNCQYFFSPNLALNKIQSSQIDYLREGRVEYVVMRDSAQQRDFQPLSDFFPNYELIGEATGTYESIEFCYRLYRRVER